MRRWGGLGQQDCRADLFSFDAATAWAGRRQVHTRSLVSYGFPGPQPLLAAPQVLATPDDKQALSHASGPACQECSAGQAGTRCRRTDGRCRRGHGLTLLSHAQPCTTAMPVSSSAAAMPLMLSSTLGGISCRRPACMTPVHAAGEGALAATAVRPQHEVHQFHRDSIAWSKSKEVSDQCAEAWGTGWSEHGGDDAC